MSLFLDQLAADRDGVFLNPDEFAAAHTIDGAGVVCVISSALSTDGPAGMEAVWSDRTVLHCSTESVGRWPVGSRHTIDGARYTVESVDEAGGMYSYTLTRTRS